MNQIRLMPRRRSRQSRMIQATAQQEPLAVSRWERLAAAPRWTSPGEQW